MNEKDIVLNINQMIYPRTQPVALQASLERAFREFLETYLPAACRAVDSVEDLPEITIRFHSYIMADERPTPAVRIRSVVPHG